MIKIYCIVAKESLVKMNGNRGKLAAQAGHAYLHSFWNAEENHPDMALSYKHNEHAYKICLIVNTVTDLQCLYDKYRNICGVALIEDAGFTVFDKPTVTCLGIGPIHVDKIEEDLSSLKVFM